MSAKPFRTLPLWPEPSPELSQKVEGALNKSNGLPNKTWQAVRYFGSRKAFRPLPDKDAESIALWDGFGLRLKHEHFQSIQIQHTLNLGCHRGEFFWRLR